MSSSVFIRFSSLCLFLGATLFAILFYRTFILLRSRQIQSVGIYPDLSEETTKDAHGCVLNHPTDEMTERLAHILKFKTISGDGENHSKEFLQLHEYLVKAFPKVHQWLKPEIISNYSLIYTWHGYQPELKPVLLAAHMDVVPVTNSNNWEADPFTGDVKDGYIYGRGAMDAKMLITGILESIEHLLSSNWKPARTFVLAFGHDEEINGVTGASSIALNLKKKGMRFKFILDEGMTIVKGLFPQISKPVALVGTAEKGYMELTLETHDEGGHSSIPPKNTAIGILSKAIVNIEENPIAADLSAIRPMLEYLAPEHPSWFNRIVLSNLWLFSPLVLSKLDKKPTSALLRTMISTTMIQGGVKSNVLPPNASAIVNIRILPGQTKDSVRKHIINVINDDRVKVSLRENAINPSPITDVENNPNSRDSFLILSQAIKQIFPDCIIVPSLMIANTDTKHYWDLSDTIFRFSPMVLTDNDLNRIHGVNERLSIKNYVQLSNYYYHLIKIADKNDNLD